MRSKILLIVGSLACALFAGEAVLGAIFPNEYCVWPPNIRHVFHTNPRYVPGVAAPSRFETNSTGLRGDELKESDHYRILAIGGSTTLCEYVDQSRAWPQLLQEMLNQGNKEGKVWVGNAGLNGKDTRHHLTLMRYLPLKAMKIEAVVLLVGVNDFQEYLDNPEYLSKKLTDEDLLYQSFLGSVHHPQPWEPFYRRTATWRAWRRVKQNLQLRSQQKAIDDDDGAILETWRQHRRGAKEIRFQLPDLTPGLDDYARNINRIIDVAKERSVRVIFVTQPTMWRAGLAPELTSLLWFGGIGNFQAESGKPYYSAEALEQGMRAYNERLLGICKARAVECVDISGLAKDTSVFYDDVHFNDGGNREVAERLAAYLQSLPPFNNN